MSFLSQSFQSTTAATQASLISVQNSTTVPLPFSAGGIDFEGAWVSGENYSNYQGGILSDTECIVKVVQSFFPETGYGNCDPFIFTYTAGMLDTLQTFFTTITCPFVKIYVTNLQAGNTVFLLSSKLTLSSF